MKRRIRDTHEFPYVYKLYDTGGTKRIFKMEIGADSPKEAVKKAGFDYVEDEGGHIELSRKGVGYTNAYINIYFPEDVASSSKPSFVMERVFK